ncbi:uncharacterized protein LOC128985914 [Macrosteles quadrilineatus]|uniref:uncharacterized protein LOC128985914 n=1 Tax=Macrosteles quadrilineatus TaxID=74068 RepID=UPI0023E12A56|nr:uncharacterized protein LOC128985914 [Macrosteles quadrilineatus]
MCNPPTPIQESKSESPDVNKSKTKDAFGDGKSKNLRRLMDNDNDESSESFCQNPNSLNKNEDKQLKDRPENCKPLTERLSLENQAFPYDAGSDNIRQNAYINISKQKVGINEHRFEETFAVTEKSKIPHKKTVFGESKNYYNSERRSNPPLSIPTKGELKRFPTPERNMPIIRKTELCLDTKETKSEQKMLACSIGGDLEENQGKEVAKLPSSKIVESILHDFDESNSIGCDIQIVNKEKPDIIAVKESKVNCDTVELETCKHQPQKDTFELKTSEPSQTQSEEKGTVFSAVDQKERQELHSRNCDSQSDIDAKVRRKSQRKSKVSKYKINNDRNNEDSNCSTETQKIEHEHENLQPIVGDDNIQSSNTGYLMKTDSNDKTLQNFTSENAQVTISSAKSNEKQLKPCPLSRKSKSYISQNLPLSFDLSVDGHLIRRGFKTLRVRMHTLAHLPSTTSSLEVSSASTHGDSDSESVDKLSDKNAEFLSEKNTFAKQNLKKPKKRVSFDLNVSEIFDDFKSFSDNDEDSVNHKSEEELNDKDLDRCESGKVIDTPIDNLHFDAPNNNQAVSKSKCEKVNLINIQNPNDCKTYNPAENTSQSIAYVYQNITKTLASLRETPFTKFNKRKAVAVSIPSPQEMPEMKFLSSLKKSFLVDSKTSNLQEASENLTKLKDTKTYEENTKTEPFKEKNINKDTSTKYLMDVVEGKDSNVSDVCTSDNDDSMILDKELSDLAKGCLDSDSNVGEDDDSVLNFGMVASEDSSVDNEFNLNCKNVEFSKSSARPNSKLTSPHNVKKRLARKFRSVNIDRDVKISKDMDSDMNSREENSSDGLKSLSIEKKCGTQNTENSTQMCDEPSKDKENLIDEVNKESTLADLKENDNCVIDATLTKENNHRKTMRRISKRQKSKLKKVLDEQNNEDNEDLSCVGDLISTSKINENVNLDPVVLEFENKEVDSNKDIKECCNQSSENLVFNDDCPNNNLPYANDKSKAIDSKNELVNSSFNINSEESTGSEKQDIAFIDNTNITPVKNTHNTTTLQKNKRNNGSRTNIKPFKTDVEPKLSTLRKSRRGKLLEQDSLDSPEQTVCEEKINQTSDSKGKVNEMLNTRRTRSGKIVENDSTCDVYFNCKTKQDSLLNDIESLTAEKQIKKSISIPEKELHSEILSHKDYLLACKTDCSTENMDQTEKVPNQYSKAEEANTDTSQKESVIEGHIGISKLDHSHEEFIVDEHKGSSNASINGDNTDNNLEEVKKLEDVSSTTLDTAPKRKTRSSQRKKGCAQGTKETYIEPDKGLLEEISESPSRKTRSKCDIIEPSSEDKQNSNIDCTDVRLNCESNKLNQDIIKDESNIKNPSTIERTSSTDSADEPLIFTKNKLIADKNKTETPSKIPTTEFTITNGINNTTEENDKKDLKKEDIKLKCMSSVASGSTTSNQGNIKESNASNGDQNVKDTKSDGNGSYSSDNKFSNSDNTNNTSNFKMNDISNSDNSSNSPISVNVNVAPMKHNQSVTINPHSLYSTMIHPKCSLNPKLKEAMRKKRDKAEVDAEIKRRLAEIDELEKLARSQHKNVLEKIGARTRSLTMNSNIDEEDDVVSISSDDSQGTSVGTNEVSNAVSKISDIGKSEDINEEPTTTQEDMCKTSSASALIAQENSSFSSLLKGSVSILPIDCTTKKNKLSYVETENTNQEHSKNQIKLCVETSLTNVRNKKDDLNNEKAIVNLPQHVSSNVTLEICKTPSSVNKQQPVLPLSKEPKASRPIKNLRNNQRDVVSIYQFRESDESDTDEEINQKQKYNRVSRKSVEMEKQKPKANHTSKLIGKSLKIQEKSDTKSKYLSVTHERSPDKNNSSLRDPSPFNEHVKKTCESAEHSNNQKDLTLNSNAVPEPDSSTSVMDPSSTSCKHSGGLEKPTDSPKDERASTQGDEINSVVSSNNTSQESDMTPSSPITGFKQPYRKSMVNRRRKKRRSYFGRCMIPNNNLGNSSSESFDDNDHTGSQSEEVVSSSVTSVQIPQDKKKRRRRKTVMDLLMEDSMLSVTRDFPMSPNPYMFSSFYKDIDLSNSVNKPSAVNETVTSEQNSRRTNDDHCLPLKPDFLAQKLKILEKLKSISRKNRKTRQCRTLVCYNEDSLPESLVESPVGESVPSNNDGGIMSQEILDQTTFNESNQDSSGKLLQENVATPKSKFDSGIGDHMDTTLSSETLEKEQKSVPPKIPLKRGRKSKAKTVKNVNDDFETPLETASKVCPSENSPTENRSSTNDQPKDCNLSFENISKNNNDELSEFDKLLESKPKDGARAKLSYNYDSGLPRSPSEDKSDDAPDDFFSSLPSPRQSSDDESSANEITNERLSSQFTSEQKTIAVNDECFKKQQKMIPEKIICSIPKRKVGKMLPYFGDSSSDDYDDDDDDLDEDIPLSVKLTQYNEDGIKDFEPKSAEEDDSFSNSEDPGLSTIASSICPPLKKRRKNSKKQQPKIRQSGRSTRSNTCNLPEEDTEEGSKANKNVEVFDNSLDINPESQIQLRKSNRKLKKTNFLCKEPVNCIKKTLDEIPIGKDGENKIEIHLESNDEIVSFKRKGRPPKAKKLKENSLDTTRLYDQPTTDIKTSVVSEDQDSREVFYSSCGTRKPETLSKMGNEHMINPMYISDNDVKGDNDESSEPTLNSVNQKSISLRKTRGKSDIEIKINNEVTYDQNNENYSDDNANEDSLLEDLPLNKRAAREITSRKRGRKDNLFVDDSTQHLILDNPVTKTGDDHESIEDASLKNKDERNQSLDKTFNESPPSLVRTRARRAKLLTSDCNDLDPPSLETSIQPSMNDEKYDFDASVNTDSNLESVDTLILSDTNLPPRKRGRKPKTAGTTSHQKDDKDETFNETPKKGAEQIKPPDNEELNQRESRSIDLQPLPKKRGRRGRRKIYRKKPANNKYNKNESDVDSDAETNMPEISTEDDMIAENNQLEVEEGTNNSTQVSGELIDNASFVMKDDGRKRRRKPREDRIETEIADTTTDIVVENGSADIECEAKKRKTSDIDLKEESEPKEEASTSEGTVEDPHSHLAQSCANQPFLWNRISAFLNKSTRSVGTQVRVKNLTLKGFETSEPEVSLQSELTLPQVIKTLFEELRFIDSSFSNS